MVLNHVRDANNILARVCQVYDSRMLRMNFESGKSLEIPSSGTWNLNDEDLRRYGRGGLEFML